MIPHHTHYLDLKNRIRIKSQLLIKSRLTQLLFPTILIQIKVYYGKGKLKNSYYFLYFSQCLYTRLSYQRLIG